jgi:hypothetical protein
MTISDLKLTQYQLKPTLTAEGKPWVQQCYIGCGVAINFLKDASTSWIRVGHLVRHKKCLPPPIR